MLVTFNSTLVGTNKLCVFVVIALGINYLYYTIHPKTTYMLQHITSTEQNIAWLNIYKRNEIGR